MKKKPEADLRKKSGMFFNLGLIISLALAIIAFQWRFYEDGNLINLGSVEDNFEEIMEIPPTEQPPPPPPVIQQPEIIEVPDEEEIEQEIEIDLDVEITEDTAIEEIIVSDEPEDEEADEVFYIVEEQAKPYGGMKAFYEYFRKHVNYPPQARRMGIQGRVFVQFTVDKDGSLTDIKVSRGIGAGCDEEALRILKNHPKWKPGKQRGRPVKVRMTIPVIFRLN